MNSKTDDSIAFKESIRQKLPADFNVNEIGNIDLLEAEKIANEDIVFLSEDDLILELEDVELFQESTTAGKDETSMVRQPPVEESRYEVIEKEVPLAEEREEAEHWKISEELAATDEKKEKVNQEITGEKDLIEENIETTNLDDLKVTAPEEIKDEIETKKEVPLDVETADDAVSFEVHEELSETVKPDVSEDLSSSHAEGTEEIEKFHETQKDQLKYSESKSRTDFLSIDDYIKDHIEDKDSIEVEEELENHKYVPEPVAEIHKEELPGHLISLAETSENVFFADDGYVLTGEKADDSIFEQNELEKITGDIVEVIEGRAKVLYEAELETDKEMVAHGLTGIAPVFEDLLLDFEDEYKYIDDEIDFIHSVITEEDYSDYLRYIDEYHGIKIKKGITNAVELMGLTPDEIGTVEDTLFQDDYKDVNLNELFEYFESDYLVPGRDRLISKNCTYIIPNEISLNDSERYSIETDLTSNTALIYEEDVDVIRDLYVKAVGAEKAEKVKVVEEIHDITDKVVIIEDEIDVDRFVMQYPEDKQDEIKKLLTYLDGLFEKLPRETLKRFVDSEYFDLYVKVLTEIGV